MVTIKYSKEFILVLLVTVSTRSNYQYIFLLKVLVCDTLYSIVSVKPFLMQSILGTIKTEVILL